MSGHEHKSRHRHKHRHKKSSGLNFIILPIIFFCATYLIIYFTLSPIFSPVINEARLLFSDSKKDYSKKDDFNNIFVPIEENPESVPVVTKKDGKQYVDNESVVFPRYGDCFGQLIMEDCDIDCKLFFGDDSLALRNGAGMYNGSFIPGYGGTTLVGGHNSTYFNGLKNAEAGQKVLIKTSYGNFTYTVTGTDVKKYNDPTAYDLSSSDKSLLVMYTCYPFDELGLTSSRFFVYAELTDGVMINREEAEE